MLVKTDTGTKDVPISEVTPQNYIVPQNERDTYHCIVEVRKFDPESGKRLSTPRIQKFGRKTFEGVVLPNLKKQGYTVEILYNPTQFISHAKNVQRNAQTAVQDDAIKKAVTAALAKQAAELAAQQQALIDAAVEKALKTKKTSKKAKQC